MAPEPQLIYRNFGAFRLLLALLVVAQHAASALAPEPLMLALRPYEPGTVAVLAFFALSGFVIAEAADTLYQDRPGAFLANRALRILPHYLAAALIAMALLALFLALDVLRFPRGAEPPGWSAFSPLNIAANLAGALPLPARFMEFKFVEIAWAVRVEFAFYIAVAAALAAGPVIAWALRRPRASSVFTAGAAAVGAGLAAAPAIAGGAGAANPGLVQYAPYFMLGAVFYIALKNRSRAAALAAAALFAVINWHLTEMPEESSAGYTRAKAAQHILLNILLAAMAVLALKPARRFERLDRRLGDLTYPLYMIHMNVIFILLALTAGYSMAAFLAAFPLSIAAAIFAQGTIDPAVNRLRDRIRGRAV